MADSGKQYYHFTYDVSQETDRAPAIEPPSISARDRVAKILRETELKDVPDLIFRKPADPKAVKKSKQENVNENIPLYSERELFTIDDDDNWDFDGELNINDYPTGAKGVTSTRQAINRNHNPSSQSQVSRLPRHPGFSTYIDDTACLAEGSVEAGELRVRSPNLLSALGVEDDGGGTFAHASYERDTQPIITISQGDINESSQSRVKQKKNVYIAIGLVLLGLSALACSFVLLLRVHLQDTEEPEDSNSTLTDYSYIETMEQ